MGDRVRSSVSPARARARSLAKRVVRGAPKSQHPAHAPDSRLDAEARPRPPTSPVLAPTSSQRIFRTTERRSCHRKNPDARAGPGLKLQSLRPGSVGTRNHPGRRAVPCSMTRHRKVLLVAHTRTRTSSSQRTVQRPQAVLGRGCPHARTAGRRRARAKPRRPPSRRCDHLVLSPARDPKSVVGRTSGYRKLASRERAAQRADPRSGGR